MTPEQYVQEKAAASGSSFYYAFLFLPPPRRAAITAFYAFCREVDDVADEVSDPGVAAIKLAWWRSEVAPIFAGQPSHPAMRALMPHVAAYGIEPAHLLAVIDGCQMDLDQSRYLDFPASRATATWSPASSAKSRRNIFGRTLPSTLDYAHRLGLAMQLTNIIRDVGDDARRGRIYLPMNELKQFDVKAAEMLERQLQRPLHRADALPGRARAPHATTRRSRCSATPTGARAEARPDDGQHLSRAAARDRGRRLRGAAPAHLADADPQALDRDAHELARAMSAARR